MTETPDIKEALLKTLATGLAVGKADSGEILFENAKFFEWFPPLQVDDASNENASDDLFLRIGGEEGEKAREVLARASNYFFDRDLKVGARSVSLSVQMRKQALDGADYLIAECKDVSKQKQAEYMLDSYSRMAEKNARDLQKEKDRVEKLLLNIMPRSVYEELKDFGTTTPQKFENASVLVLDFVGFTKMAVASDPGSTISELNDIFSAFDRITELFGCERIKTIGDSYICVSGMPEQNTDHAQNIAKVAVRMRRYLEKRNASHPNNWECRIGVASGQLIGSMVGIQKYVYDIFGPAVNLAARLEQMAAPMEIVIDENTHNLVGESFSCVEQGEQELKGFGSVQTWSVSHEKA